MQIFCIIFIAHFIVLQSQKNYSLTAIHSITSNNLLKALTSIIEIRKCPRCLTKDFTSIRMINITNFRSYIFSHSSIRIQRDETWKKFRIFIFIHPKKIHTEKSNFSTFGLKWSFYCKCAFNNSFLSYKRLHINKD